MQSSHDRDNYVQINWENIKEDMKYNFKKHNSGYISHFGLAYDLSSIMHYDSWGFSKNGKPVMVRKVSNVALPNQLI